MNPQTHRPHAQIFSPEPINLEIRGVKCTINFEINPERARKLEQTIVRIAREVREKQNLTAQGR